MENLALPLILAIGLLCVVLVAIAAVCYKLFSPPPDYGNVFMRDLDRDETAEAAARLEAALDK